MMGHRHTQGSHGTCSWNFPMMNPNADIRGTRFGGDLSVRNFHSSRHKYSECNPKQDITSEVNNESSCSVGSSSVVSDDSSCELASNLQFNPFEMVPLCKPLFTKDSLRISHEHKMYNQKRKRQREEENLRTQQQRINLRDELSRLENIQRQKELLEHLRQQEKEQVAANRIMNLQNIPHEAVALAVKARMELGFSQTDIDAAMILCSFIRSTKFRKIKHKI